MHLTWSEVNTMPYTNKVNTSCQPIHNDDTSWLYALCLSIQVISETLRRATILPWYSRKAAQDFNIDG